MSLMFNPPHPGEVLKEDVIPSLGLTQAQAADQLGVSRSAFTRVLNGHAAISPELAVRLGEWLGTSAEVWANSQTQYDLWKAKKALKANRIRVVRYRSAVGGKERKAAKAASGQGRKREQHEPEHDCAVA
ncbi:HigA family addiction module antitoxin [Massilia solisilvae]|uniref:HigA family addiction module antitoxin n=1 Tax=Massilia solisilvae TaxID=1811225 RepID=UPI0027D9AD7F|nr:HigA family addiction module antitoxin [Massilia solisilvae]